MPTSDTATSAVSLQAFRCLPISCPSRVPRSVLCQRFLTCAHGHSPVSPFGVTDWRKPSIEGTSNYSRAAPSAPCRMREVIEGSSAAAPARPQVERRQRHTNPPGGPAQSPAPLEPRRREQLHRSQLIPGGPK